MKMFPYFSASVESEKTINTGLLINFAGKWSLNCITKGANWQIYLCIPTITYIQLQKLMCCCNIFDDTGVNACMDVA